MEDQKEECVVSYESIWKIFYENVESETPKRLKYFRNLDRLLLKHTHREWRASQKKHYLSSVLKKILGDRDVSP